MGILEAISLFFSLPRLKQLLTDSGQKLVGAGNNSVVIGGALKGTPSQPMGASQAVEAVADLIDSANVQVKNAATNVKDAAVFAKSIKVPSITFSTVDTPFGKLVSGITISEASPFQAVHDELEAASGDLSAMAAKLHDASASLHTLSTALSSAGTNLVQLGEFMKQSGQKLQEFGQ
jgi:hypothetical protein